MLCSASAAADRLAYFDVNLEQQLDLARSAADLGVELFVIDDGWFGARDNDEAGLGDWFPSPTKFPGDAMRRLADSVHALGMEFGLWVEPEMVNENSDLYRAHPMGVPVADQGRTVARHQLVIDFSRTEVQDWAINLPMTMSSWVTDRPALGARDTPLRFRLHVSMSGLMAIGGDIRNWPQDDLSAAGEFVALYKDIRPLVQFGELFRLNSPDPGRADALACSWPKPAAGQRFSSSPERCCTPRHGS